MLRPAQLDKMTIALFVSAALMVLAASGVSAQDATLEVTPESTPELTPEATETTLPVEFLVPDVLNTYPHDTSAFTEGLIYANGYLYESTGEYGQSTLREVDLETGEIVRGVRLPSELFGEGLALVDDQLIQLTWREGVGIRFDLATFKPVTAFRYLDEGWGMCYDGDHLYTSNGSSSITMRSADDLSAIRQLPVLRDGVPVTNINELECVDGSIYANVWHTDDILRIDKADGALTAVIDASGLLTDEQRAGLGSEAVLNGIAYNPDTDTFYVTGKDWAWLFEVRFVEASR